MKANPSPLSLIDLFYLRNEVEFINPENLEEDAELSRPQVKEMLQELPLDIDFTNMQLKEAENMFKVELMLKVNSSRKKPGYRIHMESVGIFELDKEELEEKVYGNLRYFSSVNLMIGGLRQKIMAETAEYPFGSYVLPPVDLKDLFKKKQEQNKKRKGGRESKIENK